MTQAKQGASAYGASDQQEIESIVRDVLAAKPRFPVAAITDNVMAWLARKAPANESSTVQPVQAEESERVAFDDSRAATYDELADAYAEQIVHTNVVRTGLKKIIERQDRTIETLRAQLYAETEKRKKAEALRQRMRETALRFGQHIRHLRAAHRSQQKGAE